MRSLEVLWIVCSIFAIVNAGPKPPGENAAHGNKGVAELEGDRSEHSTPQPAASDNWDKTKDDPQSLFLNKNDKNDLEPYPMALSEDAYDGQPIRARDLDEPKVAASRGKLEHVVMRAELYGEPPSMGRQANRRKRANRPALRSALGNPPTHNKVDSRFSTANRFKRESGMRSDEILALLSLWEAQRRRNNEINPTYYPQDSYYNRADPYEEDSTPEREESDDSWLDEPVLTGNHYPRPYYPPRASQIKPPQYRYDVSYPEYVPAEPRYLRALEALRRKRQWAGFGNQRLSKRFMVAKKRSDPNPLYFSEQKNYKPREDLYSLSELLQSSQGGGREQGYPVSRRVLL